MDRIMPSWTINDRLTLNFYWALQITVIYSLLPYLSIHHTSYICIYQEEMRLDLGEISRYVFYSC
jgi:hypothetical protein